MPNNQDASEPDACSERAAKRDHALRKLPANVCETLASIDDILTELGRTILQTFHRVGELASCVESEIQRTGLDGSEVIQDATVHDSLTIARARAFFHWKPTQQKLDELLRLKSARGMAITWAHVVHLVGLPLEERAPFLELIVEHDLTPQELAGLLQRTRRHNGPVRKVKYLRETGTNLETIGAMAARLLDRLAGPTDGILEVLRSLEGGAVGAKLLEKLAAARHYLGRLAPQAEQRALDLAAIECALTSRLNPLTGDQEQPGIASE
jgi:hypothetical protein